MPAVRGLAVRLADKRLQVSGEVVVFVSDCEHVVDGYVLGMETENIFRSCPVFFVLSPPESVGYEKKPVVPDSLPLGHCASRAEVRFEA